MGGATLKHAVAIALGADSEGEHRDLYIIAISIYEFIDAQLRAGRDVLIHDKRTGETHAAMIL